ncbi:MAG: ATP-binding protein [Caldimonas sp.]
MRSLERYLLAWILGALSVGSILLVLVVYVTTLDEMNEVFDADLKNIATALAGYRAARGGVSAESIEDPSRAIATPDESGIVTSTWSLSGARRYGSDLRAIVPLVKAAGLSRQHVGAEDWIVYTVALPDGWAQAAQRVSARRETARESAANVIPPMVALVLIVGGLLSFALRRGLRPFAAAARSVAQRSARSLAPIAAADLPTELEPIVSSINDLLSRLSAAFSVQRSFLADAAHELRTPVTALRLQLQLLEQSADEAERHDALAELKAGIDRSQRLIEQFLEISGAENDGDARPMEPVDLSELARSIVAEMSLKAEHAGIDLGFGGSSAIQLHGHPHQLGVLLTNLIENAVRYTPSGGKVDVDISVEHGLPVLRVTDTGPGIPEAERGRVFKRFYRGENADELARDSSGSGLGLAIVRAITEQHHASISLCTAPGGQGLEVRVAFPA